MTGPISDKPDPAKALDEPVQRLRQWLAAMAPRRVVVGLVGLPGSGKSTLAAHLVAALNACEGPGTALALSMDGFHLTRAQLAQCADPAQALARRGAPWTFDARGLADRLRTLRGTFGPADGANAVPCWPAFDHGVGDPVPDAIAIPAQTRLILLEGLYLLHRSDGWDLSGLLDTCWYLDVDAPQALERVTLRHMASWGLDRSQAEARVLANDRLNAQIVVASSHRADWRLAAACAGL